jgi:hypothetical protein
MDFNYRSTAKATNITVDKVVGDNLIQFPIVKARSRMSWLLILISTAAIVGYEWNAPSELLTFTGASVLSRNDRRYQNHCGSDAKQPYPYGLGMLLGALLCRMVGDTI